MEEVLDVYTTPYNPEEPLICMDEAVVELQADVVPSLALEPGQDAKEDYH
jgi:hypothetical protein